MSENEWMSELPESVSHRPQLTGSPAPMLVLGATGGAGASVVSALLAAFWSEQFANTVWIDAAPGDGDMADRLGGGVSETVPQHLDERDDGFMAWRPDGWRLDRLTRLTDEATDCGMVPVIDGGSSAVRRIEDAEALVRAGVVPVLVVGARPDLINRASRVLVMWEERGLLSSTMIVLNTAVPGVRTAVMQHADPDLFSRVALDCVGLDYDPILGSGRSLEHDQRGRLSASTWAAIAEIAAPAAPRWPLAVAR